MIVLKTTLVLLSCASAFGKSISEEPDDGLNLTPYVENGKFDEARKASEVDPTLFAGVKSHAAYFTVNKTLGWNTFFWYFPVENQNEDTPWLIWLQGGPGSSSLYGLFTEIGPIQIVDGKAKKMEITWSKNYSLLFIDNPVGVGFSYSTSDYLTTNEDEVGTILLNFLQQFLEVFPVLRKAPLFITGESYAGKYIPAFGHYIHNNKDESKPINLRGLAIGDGWTDPPSLLHNAEFGLANGFISLADAKTIEDIESRARKYWEEGKIEEYKKIGYGGARILLAKANVSVYNYLSGIIGSGDDESFVPFLNHADVQKALHVRRKKYAVTDYKVHTAMSNDIMDSVKPWLEELLEHYGVMCYNGQLDLIVAYPLSSHTYNSLNWSGAKEYRKANKAVEGVGGNDYGYVKTAGNFMDVMVRGAGHMVPADQPVFAKYFIDKFVNKYKK